MHEDSRETRNLFVYNKSNYFCFCGTAGMRLYYMYGLAQKNQDDLEIRFQTKKDLLLS